MAAYAIQFRRGTTTEHSSFTGLLGEVTVDTTKKTVVVHDGSTSGGFALALESAATSSTTGSFSSNVTVGGTLAVTSTSTFGGDITVTGDIIPSANITYDLGSLTNMWKDVYIGPGSLYINGTKVIEDDSGTINFTTDINQDLKFTTSGTGTLKLISANGINITGALNATSGDLQIGDHMDMNSYLIKSLATPVSGSDATNKTYVDSAAASAVTSGSNAVSGTTGTFSSNVTVAGNLTVSGTTTSVQSEVVMIDDNIITLNSNATGTPSENAGLEVERGDSLNVQFLWNETDNRWDIGSEDLYSTGVLTANSFVGDVTGQVSDINNFTTADLTEGTDLYWTTARGQAMFDTRLATKSTGDLTESGTNMYYTTARWDTKMASATSTDLTEGTNLYYTDARADLRITNALKDEDNMASDSATHVPSQQSVKAYVDAQILTEDNTDEIVEGSTNLYWTTARGQSMFDTRMATQDTADLTEGTNLYYTTARWDTKMAAATTADLSEGTNLYFTNERVDDRLNAMLTAGSNITLTYDDAAGTMTITGVEDNFANNTTSDLAEGTNLYYTTARWDTAFGTSTTTGLTEGTNKYYTDARSRAAISVSGDMSYNSTTGVISTTGLASSTTSDLAEGSNLYYTNARADARTAVSTATNTTAWEAHSDASEAAAIASAESKDIARMVTSDAYADAAETAAIASALASAESKDVARMVTSDAYADASEAAAIASAESKDVARMVTSDAYTDTAKAAAIASAESKDIARMVTSDAYADASEAAAKSFATAADSTLQTTLQGNIDTENARIDAILSASSADKDTFAEIVTFINAVDTTNDTALGTEIVNRASGDTAAIASAESKDVARMVTSDAYTDTAEATAIASAESKDIARMVTSDAYADTAEATAIASAESKDVARMVTSDAYADASEAAAIASAESKDVARMVTSDAYADASEAAAISTAASTAESKDIARMVTSDAYADAAETAAISSALASAESKDIARMVTSDAYADAAETAAIASALASAESKDVARMVTSDAYADASEAAAIASAESKDVVRAATATSYTDTAEATAIASAESKDIARMVTSDAYADASEAAAISTAASTAESKDIARMVTSDAYTDTAKAAAIASAESKDIARMVTSDAYADAAESAAIASAESKDVARMVTSDAYTDQAELDAIASAESKDAVRATAANAYADAAVAVLTSGASAAFDTLVEIKNLSDSGDSTINATITALNHDTLSGFVADEHIDWTADQGATNIHAGNYTDTNTTYTVGDGGLTQVNFTTADNTKLDSIESNAKDDQTASEILTLIKTVDGSGSGLDADLLDGNSSAYFTSYADTAETDARAYTDTRETAINSAWAAADSDTTYTGGTGIDLTGTVFSVDSTMATKAYTDTAETDAIASAATAAQVKVDALESSMTHFHSDIYTAVVADETGTVDITFYEDNSITTPVEVGMATARHYVLYINRQLMRASEYSVSGSTVTIIAGILALDDELEVTGFKS